MLCVSFDRSYQFGVASAIDLIKGIMHCLMSFTLGWVENNHRVHSDPEFSAQPPPPTPHPLSLPEEKDQKRSVHRRQENQWSPLFEKTYLFSFSVLSFPSKLILILGLLQFPFSISVQ